MRLANNEFLSIVDPTPYMRPFQASSDAFESALIYLLLFRTEVYAEDVNFFTSKVLQEGLLRPSSVLKDALATNHVKILKTRERESFEQIGKDLDSHPRSIGYPPNCEELGRELDMALSDNRPPNWKSFNLDHISRYDVELEEFLSGKIPEEFSGIKQDPALAAVWERTRGLRQDLLPRFIELRLQDGRRSVRKSDFVWEVAKTLGIPRDVEGNIFEIVHRTCLSDPIYTDYDVFLSWIMECHYRARQWSLKCHTTLNPVNPARSATFLKSQGERNLDGHGGIFEMDIHLPSLEAFKLAKARAWLPVKDKYSGDFFGALRVWSDTGSVEARQNLEDSLIQYSEALRREVPSKLDPLPLVKMSACFRAFGMTERAKRLGGNLMSLGASLPFIGIGFTVVNSVTSGAIMKLYSDVNRTEPKSIMTNRLNGVDLSKLWNL